MNLFSMGEYATGEYRLGCDTWILYGWYWCAHYAMSNVVVRL